MTPWKRSAFFLFVLSLIDMSEAGCSDYFTQERKRSNEDWNIILREQVRYVNLPDEIDSIRCTLIKNSLIKPFTFIHRDCYNQTKNPLSEIKCDGHTTHNISYLHFMCMIASHLKRPYNGCYSGDVCVNPGLATTTTIPPPPTTTIPPPPTTTTIPPPPTTTTPTPTTTVPERTSTAPSPTTNVTQSAVHGSSADHLNADKINDIDKPTVSLISISLMFNVVLVLLVIYLWMRLRKKEKVCTVCNFTNEHSHLNGNDHADNTVLP